MHIIPYFLVDKGFFLPLRLSCKERLFSKTYPSFLTVKEGSTSHLGLLPSGKKKETALLGARNRYAIRLADHQRSSPWLCGMGPPGDKIFIVIMHSVFIGIVFYCLQIGNFIFMAYRIISYVYKFRITETYIEALKNCSCFF